jgi:anti-sigma factor RsiW
MGRDDLPVTADEISAYLDRELDPKSLERMADRLARDPHAALQLAAYRRRDEALRQAFVEGSIASALELQPDRTPPVRLLLIGMVLLIGTLVSLFLWQSEPSTAERVLDDLVADATTAHAIDAGAVLPQGSTADLRTLSAQRLSAVLQTRVQAPDLGSMGFELAASRELPSKHGLGAVLLYRSIDGRTVSCYFRQAGDEGDTSFRISQAAGVNAVYRIDDHIAYAVVGPFAPEFLIRTAELGYRQLRP